jgi:hypothetical protein
MYYHTFFLLYLPSSIVITSLNISLPEQLYVLYYSILREDYHIRP